MEKETGDRIGELVRQKLDGKSYTEIKAELVVEGVTPKEISMLLKEVDEKVLKEAVSAGSPDKPRQLYRAGLVLAVAGMLITIAYNTGIILQSVPSLAVYSIFIAGIILMFYGKMKQGKKPPPESKGPGRIRRKRPYT